MAICISASKYCILTVQQCLRTSLTGQGKQFCRELRTYARARCSTVLELHSGLHLHQSRAKFCGTDFTLIKNNASFCTGRALFSSDDCKNVGSDGGEKEKKLSLTKRFKLMFKEYWYVLIPVHLLTSVIWFGGFYYAAASGINLAGILESWDAPVAWVDYIRNSESGNLVIAYFLYKIATPARYTVSVGGTTIAIKYLRDWGWIKPVPNREQIKQMYQDKKDALKDFTSSYRGKIQVKKDEFEKTKKEMKQQYEEVRDGLQRSVLETKKDFKEGVKHGAAEWKHIGGLVAKEVKGCFQEKKADYVGKIVDTNVKRKNIKK